MPQVGYGQTVPVSTPGKIIAAFTMLFGILLIALPMAIVPRLALGHALCHSNHYSGQNAKNVTGSPLPAS